MLISTVTLLRGLLNSNRLMMITKGMASHEPKKAR